MKYDEYAAMREELLSQMRTLYDQFQPKFHELMDDCLARTAEKRYARDNRSLHLGYYCPNIMIDRVIGRCKRGSLLKSYPKKKEPDFEYFFGGNGTLIGAVENGENLPRYHFILNIDSKNWDIKFDHQERIIEMYVWAYKGDRLDFYLAIPTYVLDKDISFRALSMLNAWLYEYNEHVLDSFEWFYQFVNPQEALEYLPQTSLRIYDVGDCRHIYKLRPSDGDIIEYDVYDYHMKEDRMVYLGPKKLR